MPNWCNNNIRVTGEKKQIDAFVKFLNEKNGKNWFDFFLPLPESEKDNWYEWSINNWGCKWNCDAADWSRKKNDVSFWFDSAWAPPVTLYEFMTNEGFDVEAFYIEEGIGFVGRFADGFDENYSFDMSDPDTFDSIPEEIVEYWELRTRQEDFLAEQEDFDSENDENAK